MAGAASCRSFAKPKSSSFVPDFVSMMLPGSREQLIEGNLKRPCQLLQSCNRRNEVTILDARNVNTKQPAPFLDLTLGQALHFTNGAYAVADEHGGLYRSWWRSFRSGREFA